MKKVFEIYESEIIDGRLALIGRTHEDFARVNDVYLKSNLTNNFKKVIIDKIIIYRRETDILGPGLTAKILIYWNDSSYKDYDNFLYVK